MACFSFDRAKWLFSIGALCSVGCVAPMTRSAPTYASGQPAARTAPKQAVPPDTLKTQRATRELPKGQDVRALAPSERGHGGLYAGSVAPAQAQVVDHSYAKEARALTDEGRLAYRQGDYERAEALLKKAIALHPFEPEAHLLLGKIYLLRGSATRDGAMIEDARRMFEMAATLDPHLQEPQVLMNLVSQQ